MIHPKPSKFSIPPNLVTRFETSNSYWNGYVFYKMLWIIGNSRLSPFLGFLGKVGDASFRRRKYYEQSYRYFFINGDFHHAYGQRITRAVDIEIERGEYSIQASNYLDIVWSAECEGLFALSRFAEQYLKERHTELNIFSKILSQKNRMQVEKILFFGPSANLSSLNNLRYEIICFNKPVDLKSLEINPKNVILILNNIWSIQKKIHVLDWLEKYPEVTVFSPNDLSNEWLASPSFSIIPKYPFECGPMGLQRALTVVLNEYNPNEVEIFGFNFQLASDSYKEWYPSLHLEEGFHSIPELIIHANLNHDFLLNYCYTRRLSEFLGNKMTGSLHPYLSESVENILALLRKRILESKV